jgi:DNA-binding MarR family transcriptional regulator
VTITQPAGIIAALQQATHVTLHALASRLEHLQLTASEQNVLAALDDGQARAVGQLAAATGTRPTTLTSVLDRLERRQLLVRALDPADRRSFLIAATAAGRTAAGEVLAAMTEVEQAAAGGLTAAQLAGFRAVTRALTEVR